MADIDALLGITRRTTSPEPKSKRTTKPRPVDSAPDPEQVRAHAKAQAAAIETAAREFTALLPEIKAAHPVMPEREESVQLTGEDWVLAAWKQAIFGGEAAAFGLDRRFSVSIYTRDDRVYVEVIVPPELAGEGRAAVAQQMVAEASRRQNLGVYDAQPGRDKRKLFLIRDDAIDTSGGWRETPKTAAFHRGGGYRRGVWDLAGLVQKAPRSGQLRYPQCEFRSGDRGGEAVLTLPPGMLPQQVIAAEPALRQALAMPQLTVDAGDGLHPVIHLNTRALVREFPKPNPLRVGMFVRPRTMAERHAAAKEFVLPLGVREDGSPILVRQDVAPHMGVFGGTGQGKTVLLSGMVRAAVLQGAEVILADAKNGKDLRQLALAGLPGVVHYSSGSEAGLHRVVSFCRDELERRKVLAAKLQQRGIEYIPTPLLLVFDEVGAWLDDQVSGGDKAAKAAAQATIASLSYIAAQAREQRVFLLVAGQHAYVSAFSGRWKSNTSTLVVLGPPTENHRSALFTGEQREAVKELGGQLSKSMKGRGLVADTDTGQVTMFQGFYSPPGPDAQALDRALARVPKLRRFAWRFPGPGEDGGDGSWMDWTPASDPSSDSLPVQILDLPNGSPDPAVAQFDPISPAYSPGAKPLAAGHVRVSSYDK